MTDPLGIKHNPSEISLADCAKEPIHIPCSIQDHGCLLVIDPESLQIIASSANTSWFLELDASQLNGRKLESIIPQLFPLVIPELSVNNRVQTIRKIISVNNNSFVASTHQYQNRLFLEIEKHTSESSFNVSELLGNLFLQLQKQSLQNAADIVVRKIREFIGFDRVMLYQFHEDDHGSVIAESHIPELQPFLGLHYPATDIPAQARRLYAVNWTRLIADVRSAPVPMIPALDYVTGTPHDMSHCAIRAVSPIHIEYLCNMGVGASMSISIMNGDKLWGLIACHHNLPKVVSPSMRDSCEMCGLVLSTWITNRWQKELVDRQVYIGSFISELLISISQRESLSDGIAALAGNLAGIMDAQGISWHLDGRYGHWGLVPDQQTQQLIHVNAGNLSQDKIFCTDRIGELLPQLPPQNFAGVLLFNAGIRSHDGLMFFRGAAEKTITWAGKKDQSIHNYSGRLSPRKSFEAWVEEVKGHSKPWTDYDREAAHMISHGLRKLVVEQVTRIRKINDELRQLNTDLDAFAYAASHDLKEPLRGIYFHVYQLENLNHEENDQIHKSLQGLKKIVKRMSDLLDGLLRFSRAGRADLNIEPINLQELISQVEDLIFSQGKSNQVHITINDPDHLQIYGDFICVREILSNLITNAIKYNDNPSKIIEVGLIPTIETPLQNYPTSEVALYVKDNGIGIAKEYRQKVFEIFYRLHNKDEYGGGSGAGLTIVRRMVERHGGLITLDSDDSGTTFFFTLGENPAC